MSSHPYFTERLAGDHRRSLLSKAASRRLAREASNHRRESAATMRSSQTVTTRPETVTFVAPRVSRWRRIGLHLILARRRRIA